MKQFHCKGEGCFETRLLITFCQKSKSDWNRPENHFNGSFDENTTETLFQVPHVSLQNVRYGVEGVEYGKNWRVEGNIKYKGWKEQRLENRE